MLPLANTAFSRLEERTSFLEKIWEKAYITNNGTLILQFASKKLGLLGEIITTPYTHVATINSILWKDRGSVVTRANKEMT